MAAAAAWLASARIRRRGRHADLGLWRGANGGAAFGRLRGCVFPGWFCARRNPRMWEPALLRELAAMAAPGATLATWACTGELRRALSESGFDARRETGYGGKWHMTVATARAEARGRAGARPHPAARPRRRGGRRPGRRRHRAGLALRGWRVTVLDAARAGGVAAHAGHMAAALTPVVARDDNARARLSRAGSARALARWRDLPGAPHRASAARCNWSATKGARRRWRAPWKRWRFPPSGCGRLIAMKPARWPACRWRAAARISRRAC